MNQLEALKQKAKNAGDAAEAWRGRATQLNDEKLNAQVLSLVLAIFLLASNGGWFAAFMWL